MIRGTPKFDSIAVGEFTAAFLGPTLQFEAKAAFTNTATGETHGWTKNATWSPPVIAKLKELRELMEMDLSRIHFVGGTAEFMTQAEAVAPAQAAPRGLGDHLGTGEPVPQV